MANFSVLVRRRLTDDDRAVVVDRGYRIGAQYGNAVQAPEVLPAGPRRAGVIHSCAPVRVDSPGDCVVALTELSYSLARPVREAFVDGRVLARVLAARPEQAGRTVAVGVGDRRKGLGGET
jgi:hypothetical protein